MVLEGALSSHLTRSLVATVLSVELLGRKSDQNRSDLDHHFFSVELAILIGSFLRVNHVLEAKLGDLMEFAIELALDDLAGLESVLNSSSQSRKLDFTTPALELRKDVPDDLPKASAAGDLDECIVLLVDLFDGVLDFGLFFSVVHL